MKYYLIIGLLVLAGCTEIEDQLIPKKFNYSNYTENMTSEISFAMWNIQTFGDKKASNETLMNFYADKIKQFDVFIIQEIRDKDGSAFQELCDMLPGYECFNSSRAGRTISKEQYGVFYRSYLNLYGIKDYNPDPLNRWERPPLMFAINFKDNTVTFITAHLKPSDVSSELTYLQELPDNLGKTVIIGDLNADCMYYEKDRGEHFQNAYWLITDLEDTTVSDTDCAYDRIIVDHEAFMNMDSWGVYREGITKEHSDHYIVWGEIK